MPTYDLRTAPWIPVRFPDGSHGAVGLRDALVRAHEIVEIALDNPMEVSALYRLLLALSVRIFPQTGEPEGWRECWDTGRFDASAISRYFDRWGDRFDLFHPEHPFYQVRSNTGQGVLPVGLLRLDEGGNTSPLFSHDDLNKANTYTPAEAARGLVASQHAAIGGLLSNPYKTGNRNSPAVGGAIFWLSGASLFHALLLNAPPASYARMKDDADGGDVPAWERPESPVQQKRAHRGLLDHLTFQHRRITLIAGERDGAAVVAGILRTGGDIEDSIQTDDPHMAVIHDEKTGPRRYNMQSGKALWRDAPLFLTLASGKGVPPPTFQWLYNERGSLGLEKLDIDVFVLRTRGANDGTIKFWRRERLPLFINILGKSERSLQVVRALERAEVQSRYLASAIFLAACGLRHPSKEYTDLGALDKEDARKLARSLDTDARYWSALEAGFYDFLRDIAGAPDPESDPDWATAQMNRWTRHLHRTAYAAYDAATSSLDASARQLKAVVEGRGALRPAAPYKDDIPGTMPPTASIAETTEALP